MEHFTPTSALVGGVLIGLAAALLWFANGRLAGISNIVGQLFLTAGEEMSWRLCFVAGLLTAGAVTATLFPDWAHFELDAGYGRVVLAGLLVGVGTRLGSGCTSGHGICGVGRLSVRSAVATCCFVGAGMLTVGLLGIGRAS